MVVGDAHTRAQPWAGASGTVRRADPGRDAALAVMTRISHRMGGGPIRKTPLIPPASTTGRAGRQAPGPYTADFQAMNPLSAASAPRRGSNIRS